MNDAEASGPELRVDLGNQTLALVRSGQPLREYPVSTGIAGGGETEGSGRTPRGWHVIRAKIGGNQPRGTVFVGRRPTGEIYSPVLARREPGRDWILTRVMWLSGLEVGRNRLGRVDTMRRYIYIHGTPDEEPMGVSASHGCIRMRNDDVMDLFDRVSVGTRVLIVDREET